ncbi:hypothetical protein MC885_018071 [Smutsia gigantea]|nr:hypothetical protein MC885_018071 [Smutsia gigantea]
MLRCSPTSTRSGRSLCPGVKGKTVSEAGGNIDDSLTGGKASADGSERRYRSTVISDVDTVMNHHLQETGFTEEAYKKNIKNDMKSKANLNNRDQKE